MQQSASGFSKERIKCEVCGVGAFAPFADKEGGYCHFCEKYDTDEKNDTKAYQFNQTPVIQPRTKVNTEILRTLPDYEYSNFSKYFDPIFGDAFRSHCWNNFHLRSDCFYNLVIPHYNYDGDLYFVKTMPYLENGHRNKKYGAFSGFHYLDENHCRQKYYTTKSKGFRNCLFNEVALNPKWTAPFNFLEDSPVVLVESEKTVIIASYFESDFIWVASGGVSGLTDDKIKRLYGRKILVAFDNGEKAQEKARNLVEKLNSKGLQAMVHNYFEEDACYPDDYDIADYLIDISLKNNERKYKDESPKKNEK